MVGRETLPTWRAGVIWSQLVHVRIFRPTVLKSPSYEPKTLKKWPFWTHFSSRRCYAFAYYKQDIAHLNAVRTSTHCAKLAKYAGVSWHWAGGAERLIRANHHWRNIIGRAILGRARLHLHLLRQWKSLVDRIGISSDVSKDWLLTCLKI